MRVAIFGATGMVGSGVLTECVDDPRVRSVLAVGRRPCGRSHPKLRELVVRDLLEWPDAPDALDGLDACFFCLGTSAAGMGAAAYRRVTYDLTVSVARAFAEANPGATFCYVSGQGTDASERGRFMWARVKGATENELLRMPLDAYMLRPGFIQPMKGARSRTPAYRLVYAVLAPFFPLVGRLFPRHVTTTVNVGRAMIELAAAGSPTRVLGNRDIDRLAAGGA